MGLDQKLKHAPLTERKRVGSGKKEKVSGSRKKKGPLQFTWGSDRVLGVVGPGELQNGIPKDINGERGSVSKTKII